MRIHVVVLPARQHVVVTDVETLQLLNAELAARRHIQRSGSERVEVKALLLVGFALTLAQITASHRSESNYLPVALVLLFLAALAGLAVAIARPHAEVPHPRRLVDGLGLAELDTALTELISNRVRALEQQARRDLRMVCIWYVALVLLLAGAVPAVLHLTQG
jgi:drug/metabolite transporter (DMT)-like permease